MKAMVIEKYGPPNALQLKEIEKPIPKDDEVLIKVHAATVTAGDCEIRRFQIPLFIWIPTRIAMGIRKPRKKILGQELAGEIEAVGKDVTLFRQGDQVVASTGFKMGAYAEYSCLPMTYVMARKQDTITYEEAATIPVGGLNSYHFLRKAKIRKGEKVLICGAGGSIGTYGVQLAKACGAEVTAVDHPAKLEMLRAIGADHTIDYTKEDFTRNRKAYDVIFDVVGKSPYSRSIKSLKKNGRYLFANLSLAHLLRGRWTSLTSRRKVIIELAGEKSEDLILLQDMIKEGKIRPVIDKRYPLEQTAEAHRYVETGRKKGSVVITVGNHNP